MKNAAAPLAILILSVLPSCARDDTVYPSLAPRLAEQRGFGEPQAPPAAPIAVDPALDAKIATLRRQLTEVAAGFDRAAKSARTAAARSGARTVGSDAWLEAQTQLAQLDDWRAQASSLATDADGLAAERAAALSPIYPSLEDIRLVAAAEASRQDAAITTLAASLPVAA